MPPVVRHLMHMYEAMGNTLARQVCCQSSRRSAWQLPCTGHGDVGPGGAAL